MEQDIDKLNETLNNHCNENGYYIGENFWIPYGNQNKIKSNNRIEILKKVANGEMTVERADKELFVLYGIMRSKEPLGLIKHINGTLRTIIKTNKEDAKYWQDWNIMCLKHCINQLKQLK